MPQSLVNTVWDDSLNYYGGEPSLVRTAWDTPGAGAGGTNAAGVPVGGVTATNVATGPTGGYGYGYDPFGGGGAATSLASSAAKSNLAAAPDITKITELINALNEAEQQKLNQARLGPAGQAIQDQLLTNAADYAAGRIPESEINQLAQMMSERQGGAGFGVDSPNTSAALARAFNIRQGDLQAQGEKQYLDILAANPSAPLYAAQGNLVTPDLYASTASAQAQRQLEQQRLAQASYEAALNRQQEELNRQNALRIAQINAQARYLHEASSGTPTPTTRTGTTFQPAYSGGTDYSNYPGLNYDPYASTTFDPGSIYSDFPGYEDYTGQNEVYDYWSQQMDPFMYDYYGGG